MKFCFTVSLMLNNYYKLPRCIDNFITSFFLLNMYGGRDYYAADVILVTYINS